MSKITWSILITMLMVVAGWAQLTKGDADGPQLQGSIERISDLQGADCGPYLAKVLETVRANCLPLVPPEAKAPELKSGKGAIEFTIAPDGKVSGVKTVTTSGDAAMDQAASEAIQKSQPFAALPAEFHIASLTLRFKFAYNPKGSNSSDEAKRPGD